MRTLLENIRETVHPPAAHSRWVFCFFFNIPSEARDLYRNQAGQKVQSSPRDITLDHASARH
jgi:hypothetical protein